MDVLERERERGVLSPDAVVSTFYILLTGSGTCHGSRPLDVRGGVCSLAREAAMIDLILVLTLALPVDESTRVPFRKALISLLPGPTGAARASSSAVSGTGGAG